MQINLTIAPTVPTVTKTNFPNIFQNETQSQPTQQQVQQATNVLSQNDIDYDNFLDLKQKEMEEKLQREKTSQPKYQQALLKQSKLRRLEREQALIEKVTEEQTQDKVFITPSYAKKLQEIDQLTELLPNKEEDVQQIKNFYDQRLKQMNIQVQRIKDQKEFKGEFNQIKKEQQEELVKKEEKTVPTISREEKYSILRERFLQRKGNYVNLFVQKKV